MATEAGLRERKKQRTRELISDAAFSLFAQRGFEAVTVADVAREAEVSEATVFNYFPTKEDLVYGRMEAFEEEMLAALRARPDGESLTGAFGRFVLTPRGFLVSTDDEVAAKLEAMTRVIAASPSLLARERQIYDRYTTALAALVGEEMGAAPDQPEPWVIANALIGLHRAMIDYVRRELLAGADRKHIARGVKTHGRRALALLERGLA